MKKKLLWILIFVLVLIMVGPFLIPLPEQPDLTAEAVAPGTGRFLTVDGVKTHILDIGPRDGPGVLLIHGFGGSTFSWRETLPFLASAGFRAVALDLKGFGLADKRFEEDYSHASQAAFVAGVMDNLSIERASFVGHSMGGSVVAHLAQQNPDRVEKLVFVDGSVSVAGGGAAIDPIAWLIRFWPTRQWARIAMRSLLNEEQVAARLRTAYYDPEFVTPEIEDAYLAPQRIKDWDLALLGITRDSSKNSLPLALDQFITVPTLIIWGEEDSWVPLERGWELQGSIPGSELFTIPASGHLPMEEQAAVFNARLLEFLQSDIR
jgi:pimeloyl-ACP methyl ester carboxylesterase